MIIESIGRAYRWIRDRQLVEIQRQVMDPETRKWWWEYQTIIYTSQARMIEEARKGEKIDVKT